VADDETIDGFIVDSFLQPLGSGSVVALLGRAADGRTFAVTDDRYPPRLFVRSGDAARAAELVGGRLEETERTTMEGEPVVRHTAATARRLRQDDELLRANAIRTYEADFSPVEAALIEMGVRGAVRVAGPAAPGKFVDLVFQNPRIEPIAWEPKLSVLSIDIETDVESGAIIAVSLVGDPAAGSAVTSTVSKVATAEVGTVSEVLLVGDAPGPDWITGCTNERELLERLVRRIAEIDPDVITGWNVIDFDLAVIARRLDHHRLPFAIARSSEPARFFPADRDQEGVRRNAGFRCRGRQVIDGLRLMRYGPQHFADRKLGSVANVVLGEGKTIAAESSREKVESIMRLYRVDPVALCEYCRTDADLVLRILEKTGLLELTIARSRLTGIAVSRAWTSIPAFEFLYTEAMHERGMVAPTRGVDLLPMGEAPGGGIIAPQPGLYGAVLVFDFKSLYPSLMRTFNLDPVSYRGSGAGYRHGDSPPPVAGSQGDTGDQRGAAIGDPTGAARRAETGGPAAVQDGPDVIVAPNGARFARAPGILPALLDRFWASRDAAKRSGDDVASYVYKIIMNSFYGVLGTPQCRFAGAALAGAITSFGQYFLHWTEERFTEQGYRVIYGDTDSLFVLADVAAVEMSDRAGGTLSRGVPPDDLRQTGARLAAEINDTLSRFIEAHWGVESKLELEFEKLYRAFYLPTVRGAGTGGDARGRAKSYAGIVDGTLEIKGMEAVRSDWTPAAAAFQTRLLELILDGAVNTKIEAYVAETIARLHTGELDDQLVYARRLRKPVSSYTKNKPPHVQAALLLPESEREGTISYVVTTAGPQPPSLRSAPIDLDHYVQRQLRPIAQTLCDPLGLDVSDLFSPGRQMSLF
jgi:DNA polymerase-2